MGKIILPKRELITKSQPTGSQVHINRPLTEISINYMQDAKDFIADILCPIIPVDKISNLYAVYSKEYWMRSEAALRAPSTESAGRGFGIDFTNSYNCKKYSVHQDVADEIRANADAPLSMDRDATLLVSQDLLLNKEQRVHSNLLKTGIWNGGSYDLTGVSGSPSTNQVKKWSVAGSDPVSDVYAAKVIIKKNTAKDCNTMIVARDVHETIKKHPAIIDRYKYTTAKVPTNAMLAELFEVDNYIVSNAVINSAKEGAAFSGDFMLKGQVLLAYIAPNPGIMVPSAAYMFSFNATGIPGAAVAVKNIRMEWLETDRIEGTTFFDPKLIASDLGIFLTALL